MRYHSSGQAEHSKAGSSNQNLNKKRESVFCTAASMRVLNVLRHWVSKHFQVLCALVMNIRAFSVSVGIFLPYAGLLPGQ